MRDEQTHLSRISTEWDLIFQAHHGPPDVVSAAQTKLMVRYAGAVHRYLLGALRDPELAAELDQEFALRFLRGDLHRADPSRGRFRDFLKRALRNLMIDHYRKAKRRSASPIDGPGIPEPAAPDDGPPDFERQFAESWKRELMAQAWAALAQFEQRTGKPFHTVLKCRADHPELKSPELAARLTEALGKPVSAAWVREALSRARDQFVLALIEGVKASLHEPNRDLVFEELADLGLLEYCRPTLERRGMIG